MGLISLMSCYELKFASIFKKIVFNVWLQAAILLEQKLFTMTRKFNPENSILIKLVVHYLVKIILCEK